MAESVSLVGSVRVHEAPSGHGLHVCPSVEYSRVLHSLHSSASLISDPRLQLPTLMYTAPMPLAPGTPTAGCACTASWPSTSGRSGTLQLMLSWMGSAVAALTAASSKRSTPPWLLAWFPVTVAPPSTWISQPVSWSSSATRP